MTDPTNTPRSRGGRIAIAVTAVIGVAIVLALSGFLLWALTPLGPSSTAIEALGSDAAVRVTTTDYGWDFSPRSVAASSAVVIYPGGRVDARSYAPLARGIAETGRLAVIIKVPLSLAIIDPKAAAEPIAAHPEIGAWALAGHSLGGVAASMFARDNPDTVRGLVLLASYPTDNADLSGTDVAVVSLVGTQDMVVNRESLAQARVRLPSDTSYVVIGGGNHAQFGSYGPQPGDGEATIQPEEQWSITVGQIDSLFARIEQAGR